MSWAKGRVLLGSGPESGKGRYAAPPSLLRPDSVVLMILSLILGPQIQNLGPQKGYRRYHFCSTNSPASHRIQDRRYSFSDKQAGDLQQMSEKPVIKQIVTCWFVAVLWPSFDTLLRAIWPWGASHRSLYLLPPGSVAACFA